MVELAAPKNFSKNGYQYTLLEQQGKIALFQGFKQETGVSTFEVIILRNWGNVQGKTRLSPTGRLIPLPFGVRLPRNEEFGRYAWSYDSLVLAKKCFLIKVNEQ